MCDLWIYMKNTILCCMIIRILNSIIDVGRIINCINLIKSNRYISFYKRNSLSNPGFVSKYLRNSWENPKNKQNCPLSKESDWANIRNTFSQYCMRFRRSSRPMIIFIALRLDEPFSRNLEKEIEIILTIIIIC